MRGCVFKKEWQTCEQSILGNEASVQVSSKALCTEGVLFFFSAAIRKGGVGC